MYQESDNKPDYEEIDLLYYIKAILKRKKLIFGIFLFAIIIAVAFSFFVPKNYKISTVLEIGNVAGGSVEPVDRLIGLVDSGFGDSAVNSGFVLKTKSFANTNLVEIWINSSDPEKAKDALVKFADLIILSHQSKIKDKVAILRNNLESIGKDININKLAIAELESKALVLEKEKNNLEDKEKSLELTAPYQQISQPLTSSIFALFDVREKLNKKIQEINDLNLRKNSLKTAINALESQIFLIKSQIDSAKQTEIVKNPSFSPASKKSRILFNSGIAGFLGLLGGALTALAKDWWEKGQKKVN